MHEEQDTVGRKSLQGVGDRCHRLRLAGVSSGADTGVAELINALLLNLLSPGDRVEGLGDFGEPTGKFGTVEQANEDDAVVKWDDDG